MRPWPKQLSKPAREWLAAIDRQYALDAHHRQVAIAGAEAWDRATQARQRIDADGLMRPDRFGIPKPHPLLIVERDNRGLFVRCVTALGLSYARVGDPGDDLPSNPWGDSL